MAKERGIWGCMRTFVFHLQHTLRQMSARCPHPNRGRWHTSRRWWITRAQNTSPSKVSIVIFCHLFSHWTNLWGLTTLSFYDEHGTNCVKITYLKSLIPLRYYCVDLLTKRLLTHIAQALLLTPKAELTYILFLEQFSSRVPRCSWTCQTHPRAIHGACSPAKPSLGEGLKSPHYHFGCNSTYLQFFQAYVLFQIEPFTGNVTDIHVKPWNMLILCHMLFTRHLKLFRCVSISSNYPGEPVGWLVRHTFRFPLCWCP